eukprot:CAMPEP_0198239736 /NCGR_PEP_ID=MMETSP1446-20131203/5062_1 /TAXON_ID=1461542 ORGANISM="Unidentified sp, Strain CCMP2111" /NCGR_SAMPLE_ID=MMETSP1446 /ASSEMBLY_ACC=CAM_ASM_001112 /LENGTH=40 /DNA_ID= /DNA_START= /DNA_END= /DNA_ORIENTATION=
MAALPPSVPPLPSEVLISHHQPVELDDDDAEADLRPGPLS